MQAWEVVDMSGSNEGSGSLGDAAQNTAEEAEGGGQIPVLERQAPSLCSTLIGELSPQAVRDFLRLSGTGILYALSALSILYGMGRIIGPILAASGKLGETLPCFGALEAYELAVFAVLLLIVLWRKATRDTTTLMVLVALFMGASGITLSTIANDGPAIAAVIGVACLAVAFARVWLLRAKLGVVLPRLFAAGVAVLLTWNFLISASMALTLHRGWPGSAHLRQVWLGGWHVMLLGAVLLFLSALASGTGSARRARPDIPFLRSTGMAWVFAFVLVGGAMVHQYALTYIFDVRFGLGDFLPIAVLACATLLEAMRGYGVHGGKVDNAITLVPMTLVYFLVLQEKMPGKAVFLALPEWGLGTLFQPWAALALFGALLFVVGARRRDKDLAGIALLYVPFSVLFAGALPELTIRTVNPLAFGASLVMVLFVLAALHRSVKLAFLALSVLALGAAISGGVNETAAPLFPTWVDVFLAVFGAGALGLYLGFPRHVHVAAGILGATGLAFAAIHGQPAAITFPSLALAAALAILGGLAFWRARNSVLAGVLAVPLLWRAAASVGDVTGWHYIALSFVLLGAAAFFSLRARRSNGL